ncbi:uncharacterized protein LOC133896864 [Phragmites australis]|uniref:uncharacterized protein LOC133896864 n=1 Tax=Phragmites australis TaxID=29695 RepID=UPI002D797166|nr:uncharacterized protein LOC133896864 [Phragmites australis]
MGIQRTELRTGVKPFHGTTPNSSIMPLGQIELSVTFGMLNNFRTEKLTFDVTDFETMYNVILGRPMLGKFMAVVHCAYQTLKISGPNGGIIVKGDQHATVKYDKQSLDMVEYFSRAATTPKDANSKRQRHQGVVEAKDSRLISLVGASKSNDAKGKTNDGASNKNTDGCVKAIPLDPSKPSLSVNVGANLDPK